MGGATERSTEPSRSAETKGRSPEQTLTLLGNSTTAAIINVSIALITFFAIPSQKHLWLWLIVGASLLRLMCARQFTSFQARGWPPQRLYGLTITVIAMQGAAWGFASIQLFEAGSELHRFYLMAIVCGMTAGAMLTLAPSPLAFSCFSLPAAGPLVVVLLLQGDTTLRHAGWMGVVYLIGVHAAARRVGSSSRALIESRRDLERTSGELAKHKERLEQLVDERTRDLENSREKYRKLIEEVNDAIYEVDASGVITYFSPAITSIAGYNPEELVGFHISKFIHSEDLPTLRENMPRLLAGDLKPSEYRIVDSAGRFLWVRTSSRPIQGKNGPEGLRGILTDIDGMKRTEEEKSRLLEQMHESRKLEAIGTLAGGIAHDFNNLMSPIVAYSEMLLNQASPGSTQRKRLERISSAAKEASALVKQILQFSRPGEESKSPLQLGPLTEECLKLFAMGMPPNLEIERHIDPNLPEVLADPSQIHQILMNLLTNAKHAMGDRTGSLVCRLEACASPAERPATDPLPSDAPWVCLSVEDEGHGISPEVQQRIFEPFYSTKGLGEGTGLGLSVVRGIVEDHGGIITVETQLNRGSAFRVFLPPATDPKKANPSEQTDGPVIGSERVLLVEGQQEDRDALCAALGLLGYRVEGVADAVGAQKRIAEDPEPWDAIILDESEMHIWTGSLDGNTGLSTAGPAVLVRGSADSRRKQAARGLGEVDGWIRPPVSPEVVGASLRKVFDRASAGAEGQSQCSSPREAGGDSTHS